LSLIGIDAPDSETAEARVKLSELQAETPQQTIEIQAVTAEKTVPATILKAAEENSADLIAITVSKRGWLERAVLGSVAEDIIREADIPVLSIPVRTEAKQQQPPSFAA